MTMSDVTNAAAQKDKHVLRAQLGHGQPDNLSLRFFLLMDARDKALESAVVTFSTEISTPGP